MATGQVWKRLTAPLRMGSFVTENTLMKKSEDAVTTPMDHPNDPGMVTSLGDTIETQDLPSVSGDETPLAPKGPDAKPDLDRPSPDETRPQRPNRQPAVMTRL